MCQLCYNAYHFFTRKLINMMCQKDMCVTYARPPSVHTYPSHSKFFLEAVTYRCVVCVIQYPNLSHCITKYLAV